MVSCSNVISTVVVTTTIWASGGGGGGGGSAIVTNGGGSQTTGGGGNILTNLFPTGSQTQATGTAQPTGTGGSGGNSTVCAQNVIKKIQVLYADVTNLLENVEKYENGGLSSILALLKIQVESMGTGDAIDDATNTINSCPPFSETDTADVSAALLNVLPGLRATLTALTNKKPEIDKAILGVASAGFIVEADLKSLSGKTSNLGKALQNKSAQWIQQALTDLLGNVSNWFSNAINAYANDPIISL